jgi:hypothetical protein
MTETEFRLLCRDISRALGQAEPNSLGEHGHVEVDGVEIALFFDAQITPDLLFCYVDRGPVPEEMRTEMYGQLLTMNLLSGAKTNGVYSLDPTSGNAIFVVHFMNPDSLDAKQMAQAFRIYASQTNALRTMLEEPDAASGQSDTASAGTPARGASLVDLA